MNRFLYALVGADWRWTDKSPWTDAQWREYAEADQMRTFLAFLDGSIAGYYELHREPVGDVEIAIFGLAPKFVGKGYGGALLTDALEQAWGMKPGRVWLHTCTEDHPSALPNYLARGMIVYKSEATL